MEQGRKFGLTVGIAFLILAGIVLWRGVQWLAIGFGSVGAALVVAGFVIPGRLGPVERGWMAMALAISKVTTPIFMGAVYFLVITPVGLVRRAMGKNAIVHGLDQGSYLIEREPGGRGSDLERQF